MFCQVPASSEGWFKGLVCKTALAEKKEQPFPSQPFLVITKFAQELRIPIC